MTVKQDVFHSLQSYEKAKIVCSSVLVYFSLVHIKINFKPAGSSAKIEIKNINTIKNTTQITEVVRSMDVK